MYNDSKKYSDTLQNKHICVNNEEESKAIDVKFFDIGNQTF